MEIGEQLDIFDLIPLPTKPPSEPDVHLRELPANYAKVATQGRPWEWIVSREHKVHGAGFCKTREEAETMISHALDRLNTQS